jgi:cysteine-rich repeat protein
VKKTHQIAVGALWLLTAALCPSRAVLAQVTSADEICAPSEDPCIIDSDVVVAPGAFLDFGMREVRVVPRGVIDSGIGDVALRCGKFVATTGDSVAINARIAGVGGGIFTLDAVRRCSLNENSPCFRDTGCKFGTCSAHTCSADPTVSCVVDSQCQIGPCQLGRCFRNRAKRCTGNDDCNLGSCTVGATVCSSNLARECSIDADCDDGLCNIGDGSISMDGKIRAEGPTPGSIFITAAGDIETFRPITLSASSALDDGGILDIESGGGSVDIRGKIDAVGGGQSTGGDVTITAAQDIFINHDIDVNGGDFDGGFLALDAGRDLTINGEILGNSIKGEGFGGDLEFGATRDILLTPLARIANNGHQSSDNSCGDSGPQTFDAGGTFTMQPGAELVADGAPPECGGDTVAIDARGDILIDGRIQSRGGVDAGNGGSVEITSRGSIEFTMLSSVDVTGGANGGGFIDLFADDDVIFAGTADARAGVRGTSESISLDAGRDVFLSGTLINGGGEAPGDTNGIVDLRACGINVLAGTRIDNGGPFGVNRFTARESITVAAGSEIGADSETGTNTVEYRDPSKPPVLAGNFTPAVTTAANPLLMGCPFCGDGEVDQGESCDDGNTIGGDGCDEECQDEGCIDDTQGDYPNVPLCNDDKSCTLDLCNRATSTCDHIFDCNDGFNCTQDSCGPDGECLHVANSALCNDFNVCTTDICSVNSGCVLTNNSNDCNDGLDCTSADACTLGECVGTLDCPPGQLCELSSGQCIAGATTTSTTTSTTSTTTTSTTTTTMVLGPFCGDAVIDDGEQCDSGNLEWDTGEFCTDQCVVVGCGDPNNSGVTDGLDALYILRVAVGLGQCDACLCDVDNSSGPRPVQATDALRTLRAAVGLPIDLVCPVC